MKAIRIHSFGGPEVLQYDDVPEPVAKPGEAVVKIDAAGVTYIYYQFISVTGRIMGKF